MSTELLIDFCSPALAQHVKTTGKRSLLARAMGVQAYPVDAVLWDMTAGLGQDAFILASLGFKIMLFERNSQVIEALNKALKAVTEQDWSYPIVSRLKLIPMDALAYLQAGCLSDGRTLPEPAAVYLDPMFPAKRKKALSPKPMQMMQQLVGADPDADELLLACLAHCRCRIVVKRHRLSPFLANKTPSGSLWGKSHRFDVYRSQSTQPPEDA